MKYRCHMPCCYVCSAPCHGKTRFRPTHAYISVCMKVCHAYTPTSLHHAYIIAALNDSHVYSAASSHHAHNIASLHHAYMAASLNLCHGYIAASLTDKQNILMPSQWASKLNAQKLKECHSCCVQHFESCSKGTPPLQSWYAAAHLS